MYNYAINFKMFYKHEIPFVRLLIPLLAGIVSGWLFPQQLLLTVSQLTLATILILFLLALLFYKRLYKQVWIIGSMIHIFLFAAGYFLCTKNNYDFSYFTTKPDAWVLKIASEPQVHSSTIRFKATVIQAFKNNTFYATRGKIMVTLKTDSSLIRELEYGHIILTPTKFSTLTPAFNPGEFDFKNYLATQGIYHQAFIPEYQIKLLKHTPTSIVAWCLSVRKKLVKKLHTYIPHSQAALAATLLLGYRTDLGKEMLTTYSQTGTMHILAVSGMHVGLVFLLISVLLKPLSSEPKTKFLSLAIILVSIWFYALITALSPSVCRAAIMLSFVVIGKTFRRNQNTYNLIAASAMLLLLYNPLYLFDVGFQLSYLAVIGIIYYQPKIYSIIYVKNKPLAIIWSYGALCISAQLATFPLSIYYFHQFPIYFLLSNLFIVLPITVLMYGGILFLIIPFTSLLKPLGLLLYWIIAHMNSILIYIQQLPYANWSNLWITASQCTLIYSIMACFAWYLISNRKYVFGLFVILTFTLSWEIVNQIIQNQNRHELIFYSLKNILQLAIFFGAKRL